MPLAFRTSAVTRNIRITISSVPLVRPIVDWVVLKGTSGLGLGKNSRPRKLGRKAMMPTIESMKMIGMPASVSATKITPSATISDAPTASRTAASPQTDGPDHHGAGQGAERLADAAPALGRQPGRARRPPPPGSAG